MILTGNKQWSRKISTLYAMNFSARKVGTRRCELYFAISHTEQECTQSSSADPGLSDCPGTWSLYGKPKQAHQGSLSNLRSLGERSGTWGAATPPMSVPTYVWGAEETTHWPTVQVASLKERQPNGDHTEGQMGNRIEINKIG